MCTRERAIRTVDLPNKGDPGRSSTWLAATTDLLRRRLLSFDYVIEHPGLLWLPTKSEMIAAFEVLGIHRSQPCRPRIQPCGPPRNRPDLDRRSAGAGGVPRVHIDIGVHVHGIAVSMCSGRGSACRCPRCGCTTAARTAVPFRRVRPWRE